MKTLQLPRDSGGLAFPNIILYNWACHGRFIYDWVHCYLKGMEDPLESWACAPFRLLGELTCKKTALPKVRDNPILQSSIKIWHDMHRFVGRKGAFSYLTPLMGNRDFLPGIENVVFRSWRERGVRVVGDLFDDNNVLMSFPQAQNRFGLPQKDFFAYLQVRHFINTNLNPTQTETLKGPVDKFIINFTLNKGLITYFYNRLQSCNQHSVDGLIK